MEIVVRKERCVRGHGRVENPKEPTKRLGQDLIVWHRATRAGALHGQPQEVQKTTAVITYII